jgi:hypothetical protein
VNRRTDCDARLHAEHASEPQHLSAIGPHREVAQRARIRGPRQGARSSQHTVWSSPVSMAWSSAASL